MADQEQNPPQQEQLFVATKQVGFNLKDIILNPNNEVALLYPEHNNKDHFKCVSDFISKCFLRKPFTKSPNMYKEYLAEFWYSAKALENSKVSFSTLTGGIYGEVGVKAFRNAIDAHYLPHSSEYVAPPSIDIYYNKKLLYGKYYEKMKKRRQSSKIINCDVLTKKGPISLKVNREDEIAKVIKKFKASDLQLAEWRDVVQACPDRKEKGWKTIYELIKTRMEYIEHIEKELHIDFNKSIQEQDPLDELNDLANKKRKITGDSTDHSRRFTRQEKDFFMPKGIKQSPLEKVLLKSAEKYVRFSLKDYLKTQIQEQFANARHYKNELRKLKGKTIIDNVVSKSHATTIAPGMFNLNLEPLALKVLKNKDAHLEYIKHSREHANILREIVESDRALSPLDSNLDSACKYVQRIQEVLVDIRDTCPCLTRPSEKLVAVTPMNKDKKVRFADPVTSLSNTKKQVDSHIPKRL
ncbi:hypothetical protein Tco_0684361 [Tanacetum coccineum]